MMFVLKYICTYKILHSTRGARVIIDEPSGVTNFNQDKIRLFTGGLIYHLKLLYVLNRGAFRHHKY
jgi:hypothetical protein